MGKSEAKTWAKYVASKKKKAKTTFKSFKYSSLRTDARISSSSSWVNGAISHIFPLRHGGMGAQGRLRYKGDGGSNQAWRTAHHLFIKCNVPAPLLPQTP